MIILAATNLARANKNVPYSAPPILTYAKHQREAQRKIKTVVLGAKTFCDP